LRQIPFFYYGLALDVRGFVPTIGSLSFRAYL